MVPILMFVEFVKNSSVLFALSVSGFLSPETGSPEEGSPPEGLRGLSHSSLTSGHERFPNLAE